MALFRKEILRPGVFNVRLPNGKRKLHPVTKDYIQDIYNTATEMLAAGLQIPAPYAHRDDKGIVPDPVTSDGTPKWRSDINGGFWKKFEVGKNGAFYGYVEAPGDPKDLNSPAGKVSNTIKETSVWVEPEWKDGLNRTWKKALRHVALVTNAIEPAQQNFELVDETNESVLAMSFSMSDEVGSFPQEKGKDEDSADKEGSQGPPGDKGNADNEEVAEVDNTVEAKVSEVVSLVKEKLGFEMPSDTNCDNFLDRLRTILISFPHEEEEEDLASLKKPKADKEKPEGSEVQQSSTAIMADENPDNLVVLEKKSSKLLEKYLETLRQSITDRIAAAVKAGKIGKKYAEEVLTPQLDALVMSFDDMDEDGNFPKSELEIRLEMAENLDSIFDRTTPEKPAGRVEALPSDMNVASASKEELEKVYSNIGL